MAVETRLQWPPGRCIRLLCEDVDIEDDEDVDALNANDFLQAVARPITPDPEEPPEVPIAPESEEPAEVGQCC